MDILISSNLERLIFELTGKDQKKTLELMSNLSTTGKYEVTEDMKEQMNNFIAGYASEEDTAKAIKAIYQEDGYILDTHIAVAAFVYNEYKENNGDPNKTIIASTASPYKSLSVMKAIDDKYKDMDDFELVEELMRFQELVFKSSRGIKEC